MAIFLVQVELYDAVAAQYDQLHGQMATRGFVLITGEEAELSQEPPLYCLGDSDLEMRQVHELAEAATQTIELTRTPWIMVIDWRQATVN